MTRRRRLSEYVCAHCAEIGVALPAEEEGAAVSERDGEGVFAHRP
jgi:hypothetical protein